MSYFSMMEDIELERMEVGIGFSQRMPDQVFVAVAKDKASGQSICSAEGSSELAACQACYALVLTKGNPHAIVASAATLNKANEDYRKNAMRFSAKS